MTEDEARTRSRAYQDVGITATARMTPHPNGWPQTTGIWEVALRDDTTRRYHHENDPAVSEQAQRLNQEGANTS